MNSAIERIAIIGGDEHAWSAAARLLVALNGQGVEITIVDAGNGRRDGVLSLDPSAHSFHRKIGIQEPSLIRKMDGAYSYGIKFDRGGESFTFAFTPTGDLIDRVPFHHYAARSRALGASVDFGDYNLAVTAAKHNKFAHPKPESPLARLDYTVNVDRAKYIALLRSAVMQHEVKRISAVVISVNQGEGDLVESLTLSNGETITTDYVIDCENKLGNTDWESWSTYYEYDRQLSWTVSSDTEPSVTLSNIQIEHGSLKEASSASLSERCLSFNSLALTDQQARQCALEYGCSEDSASVRIEQKAARVRPQFWHANTLQLGLSAGYVGNQIFNDLTHTHAAIERWLELYPRKGSNSLSAAQYNATTRVEYQRVLDAHVLALRKNGVENMAGSQTIPETLAHRLALFLGTGRVAFYESDVLEPNQWVNLLMGQGYWPKQNDPLVNHLSPTQLNALLLRLSSQAESLIADFPSHTHLLNAIRRMS